MTTDNPKTKAQLLADLDAARQRIAEFEAREEAAQQAYSDLDQIFNTAGDGMRVIDRDYTILRANKAFADMCGLPLDKIIGRKCHGVFPGFACGTGDCPLKHILGGVRQVDYEVVKKLPNGGNLACLA